jgi:hypothetical protein
MTSRIWKYTEEKVCVTCGDCFNTLKRGDDYFGRGDFTEWELEWEFSESPYEGMRLLFEKEITENCDQ